MAKRKSTAQLKRLQKRAEDRGETYKVVTTTTEHKNGGAEEDDTAASEHRPHATPTTMSKGGVKNVDPKHNMRDEEQEHPTESCKRAKTVDAVQGNDPAAQQAEAGGNPSSIDIEETKQKKTVALQLKDELKTIEENKELKAKERRSAKRKAEAIAMEKTGVASAQELLDWLETSRTHDDDDKSMTDTPSTGTTKNATTTKPKKSLSSLRRVPTPNILFVGQLSFATTKEEILACFRKHLLETEQLKVADDALSVRLLTHAKTGKSKGMAFVEIMDSDHDDPLILYSCLKLHHSYLNGRCINVERTSGGGKAKKQAKVATLRQHQVDYMKETVQSILAEYDTSSLDEGVLALCERHNATVVHAGMERFVETDGPNKENPSAYLTALLQKLATEGIFDRTKPKVKTVDDHRHDRPRPPSGRPGGRPKIGSSSNRGGRR